MDNNLAYSAIRNLVIGCKNYLRYDAVAGAKHFRQTGTVKANGIEPCTYLRTVIAELPNAT